MPQLPTFFFSHARQDREMPGRYLEKFFEHLEKKVAQYAGVDLDVKRLGTIDRRIPHGEDWDKELSDGLTNNKAFILILTPLYQARENCGKEFAAFALRSPNLGIDSNGALTGVLNVLPVRWLPEEVYYANTKKDSLIPPILRRIEDTPADDGRDPERTEAIRRYRKKGMELCVNPDFEPRYAELLSLFALSILHMNDLPSATGVSFATAHNAFADDWRQYFSGPAATVPPGPFAVPVAPRALKSVVVFYVTRRPFTRDPSPADFADQLITNPGSDTDPELAGLLVDIRTAAVADGFNVFHAAQNPAVPTEPTPLIQRLATLSEAFVLTALVVDPRVWPGIGAPGTGDDAVVEQVIRSPHWTGPVLLPSFEAAEAVPDINNLVADRKLPTRLVALPRRGEDRIIALRRALLETRSRLVAGAGYAPDAERPPLLNRASGQSG